MSDFPNLPNAAREAIDRRNGVFTREWYGFFRDLAQQPGLTSSQAAAIDEILRRLSALEGESSADADIVGTASVLVSGSLLGGLVQLALDGDESTPSPSTYYGTDDAGAKGFHALPEAPPQLFNRITNDGDARIDGDGNLRVSY